MSLLRPLRLGLAVSVAALAAAGPARATQPLETFLAGAQTAGFDAREASATAQQRVAEADSAFSRLTPVFSARGVYTRNAAEVAVSARPGTAPIVITPLNQFDAFLQLDVPIIDLASYHRYRAASAHAESAEAQQGATTVNVSRGVARLYYTLHGAAALVHSATESLKAAEQNL